MTYESVDQGKFIKGKWSFSDEKKYFILYGKEKEGLKFLVQELNANKMVVKVDVEGWKDFDVHFTTKK